MIFSVGLEGVSMKTARVFGRIAEAILAGSDASTNVLSSPHCRKIVVKARYVPPYTSSPTTR